MDSVAVTPAVLALLERYRVFDSHSGQRRWGHGARLNLVRQTRLEPYIHIYDGHNLPLAMGAFSYSHSRLRAHVELGRFCSIGPRVTWLADRHPIDWASTSPLVFDPDGPPGVQAYFQDVGAHATYGDFPPSAEVTRIGHDVWIGDEAMIRQGVTIGNGAVIGAKALVLEDVPPYAIAYGLPARVRRFRFPDAIIERFQRIEWWRFRPETIQGLAVSDPERFVSQLEELLARDALAPMTPTILTGAEIIAAAGRT